MMQYRDVKPATEADVSGKLEDIRRLMEQFSMPEDERAWFREHPKWSKSNKYVELEARIYI